MGHLFELCGMCAMHLPRLVGISYMVTVVDSNRATTECIADALFSL